MGFSMTDKPNPLIYIASLPRSGSTLLSMLLGSHDRIVALGEFVLFGQSLQQNSHCSCGKQFRDCGFWNPVAAGLADRDQPFSTLAYPFEFRSSGIGKLQVAISSFALARHSRLLMEIASAAGKGYAYQMKKAHQNLAVVIDLLERQEGYRSAFFLDASKTVARLDYLQIKQPSPMRVICLIRDGRGTVNSWLKGSGSSFSDLVRSWRFHMELQRKSFQRIKNRDKIVVRYEDLCSDPGHEIRRICDFLKLPFMDEMLEMTGPFHMLGGNPGTLERTRKIRIDTGWSENFDRERLKIFDDLAGPLNRELGY